MQDIEVQEGTVEAQEPLAERLRRLTAMLLHGMRVPEDVDLDAILVEARRAMADAQAQRGDMRDFDIRR